VTNAQRAENHFSEGTNEFYHGFSFSSVTNARKAKRIWARKNGAEKNPAPGINPLSGAA
jgi:rhamnogalacturonyl hydrolase YesR